MTGVRLARLDAKLAPLMRGATPPARPACRVVIDRYRSSTGPLAQAMCRCGWQGTDNADPATAEREASEHKPLEA